MGIALSAMRRAPFARLKSEELLNSDPVPLDDTITHGHPEDNIEIVDADGERLGVEDTKAVRHPFDGAALALSLACCVVAICVLLAWRLGTKQQLVVVGFMISIMGLCLGYVALNVCIQWEVRHGHTTLQNLDGLVRRTPFGSQMDFGWRAILLYLTFLPLGLSLAYKQFFNDGTSTVHWSVDDMKAGMYPPPAVNPTVGPALMYNASQSFLQVTWSNPPLPTFPSAYGFNTLVLNETATAMLDVPAPSVITNMQSALELREIRNVTTDRVCASVRIQH